MMYKLSTRYLPIVVLAASSLVCAQTIPEQVAATGPLKIEVGSHERPVADLAQLVSDSDLIVRAVIEDAVGRLSTREDSILTDYRARITEVIRTNLTALEIPKVVRFTLLGGKLSLPGGTAEFIDHSFPLPHVGEEYVLFLRRQGDRPPSLESQELPDRDKFVIVHGPFGAYRIVASEVLPVVGKGHRLGRLYHHKALLNFVSDVAQACVRR